MPAAALAAGGGLGVPGPSRARQGRTANQTGGRRLSEREARSWRRRSAWNGRGCRSHPCQIFSGILRSGHGARIKGCAKREATYLSADD